MDIAKYIGLFLLKNNFCYIHGLGNLELKKKSASYDGQALQAPTYEVVVTLGGSIDDNLANFIATNEQISISKAANALRDFSTKSREELAEGKEVPITSLGKFVEANGRITFITDPQFTYAPPSIPSIKSATRSTVIPKTATTTTQTGGSAYTYHPEDDNTTDSGINWGKIVLVGALAVVVIAAIIFGINYMQPQAVPPAEPEPITTDSIQTLPVVQDTAVVTPTPAETATNSAITEANGTLQFDVILKTYPDSAKAAKRVAQLVSYGNNVSMAAAGDGNYYVVMPVSAAATDTTRILDSLKRTFNPQGVSILR